MRCNICDKQLTDTEVSWNKDLGTFEPCSPCLEIALEAAYSDGFRPSDDDTGGEVNPFGDGSAETLDPDLQRTFLEQGDASDIYVEEEDDYA